MSTQLLLLGDIEFSPINHSDFIEPAKAVSAEPVKPSIKQDLEIIKKIYKNCSAMIALIREEVEHEMEMEKIIQIYSTRERYYCAYHGIPFPSSRHVKKQKRSWPSTLFGILFFCK